MPESQRWQFDDEELPSWVRRRKESAAPQPRMAVPAATPPSDVPIFGRLFGLRVAVAVAIPAILFGGASLRRVEDLPMLIVLTALTGLAIGIACYFYVNYNRARLKQAQALGIHWVLPSMSLTLALVVFPLAGPLAILFSQWAFILFANRYNAMLLLVPLCCFLFYRYGRAPIEFARAKLLADPVFSLHDQRSYPPVSAQPDWPILAILLAGLLLIPAYTSTAAGIAFVTTLTVWRLMQMIYAARNFGNMRVVAAALLIRGQCVLHDYMDYTSRYAGHWDHPAKQSHRRLLLRTLLVLFDVTLLVGTTYFWPWEPFAALATSQYQSVGFPINQFPPGNYVWATLPVTIAVEASEAMYLASLLLAAILFALLPPVVLLVAYFSQLVELEQLAQQVKRRSRAPFV
jgi:hypothetical protein